MSSIPTEAPTQIGSGNDMDMIKSYGGLGENQQSSTMQGSGLSINTVPSNEVNKNPEIESKSSQSQTLK